MHWFMPKIIFKRDLSFRHQDVYAPGPVADGFEDFFYFFLEGLCGRIQRET
jgi:hypothetical protein